MSTFAVFGMTRDVALAEAKKKVKGTRKNLNAPGGVEPIPMEEWLALVEKKAASIMEGNQVRQLSVLFDAPPVRPSIHRACPQDWQMPRHADQVKGAAG